LSPFADRQISVLGIGARRFAFLRILARRNGQISGFFGNIAGLREDKMRGPEWFTADRPPIVAFDGDWRQTIKSSSFVR
jgi:hypothetical protein